MFSQKLSLIWRSQLRRAITLALPSSLLLLTFSSIFAIANKAEANLLGKYQTSFKPARKVEQTRTVGSGSRSNCESSLQSNSITLLVPEEEVVHLTSNPRPSLFLHSMVASTLPFKFTLVDPQVAQPLVEQTFSVKQPGIKKLSLPESTELERGKVYLWYVAIPCGEDPEKYQEVLGAAIERVPVARSIKTQLQSAETAAQTAAVYAKGGIWYEALEFAIQDSSNNLEQLLSTAGLISFNN